MPPLILASTSLFRRDLLDKLNVPFSTQAPDVDETRHESESAETLVSRLAIAKARQVGAKHTDALVIGSDQVACSDGDILGKPGDRANAIRQLSATSGKTVTFYTGLCLLNTANDRIQSTVETFDVDFRQLSTAQIERYVDREQPFNCAGSFKSEGHGITLFSALRGRDPNTLVGLPLIALVEMLAKEGLVLP